MNLFQFLKVLKGYIYRILTDRTDTEDLLHDVFVKSFDKIRSLEGKLSLKIWVFALAFNLCIDFLRSKKRWKSDSPDRSKEYAESNMDAENALIRANKYSLHGTYEIKEHIDFCFTCMSKTLPKQSKKNGT